MVRTTRGDRAGLKAGAASACKIVRGRAEDCAKEAGEQDARGTQETRAAAGGNAHQLQKTP